MKRLLFVISFSLIAGGLSACATSQSVDASCTAESKTAQAEKNTKRMERESRRNMRKLTLLSEKLSPSDAFSPKLQSRAVTILRDMDIDLKTGRGMLRLKSLSESCNDPQLFETSLASILKTKTMNPDLLTFVKATEIYAFWVSSSSEELRSKAVELDIPLPRMEDF